MCACEGDWGDVSIFAGLKYCGGLNDLRDLSDYGKVSFCNKLGTLNFLMSVEDFGL